MYVNEVKKSITLQKLEVASLRVSHASYPSLMQGTNIYLNGYKEEKDFYLGIKEEDIITNVQYPNCSCFSMIIQIYQ